MTWTERIRGALHALVCLCAAFALFGVGFTALQWRETAITAGNDVDVLTAHLTEQIDSLGDEQNQLRHVLLGARVSLDNVNKAAIAERLYFTTALPVTMSKFDGVLDATQQSVSGLRRVESAATTTLDAAAFQVRASAALQERGDALLNASTLLVQHADAVVTDPSVRQAEINAAQATAASAAAAQDLQHEVHGFTHPAWPHRLAHAIRRMF